MRTIKTLKPTDYVVRGAFLAIVLIGGLLDLGPATGATTATLAGSAAGALPSQCRQHVRDVWWAEVGALAGC